MKTNIAKIAAVTALTPQAVRALQRKRPSGHEDLVEEDRRLDSKLAEQIRKAETPEEVLLLFRRAPEGGQADRAAIYKLATFIEYQAW